ncbi:MAG: ribonuclease Z [Calditrichaeota bacterium]|nr:ribonuclease Z [Calditrichota bacterium]
MKWHVLGSASGLTVPNRFHSAYLLENKGKFLLIDAGDGVSYTLARQKKSPLAIESVLISHTHPDHVGGLPLLLQFMMMSGRKAPLDIFLPAFYKDFFVEQLYRFYIFPETWPFPIHIHTLEQSLLFWDSLQVTSFPTRHLSGVAETARRHGVGIESYGFRFQVGSRILVFTSDIQSVQAVSPHIQTADWLFIEGAHTSPDEICQFAVEKNIPHVRITHVPPELEKQDSTLAALAMKYGITDLKITFDGDVIEW